MINKKQLMSILGNLSPVELESLREEYGITVESPKLAVCPQEKLKEWASSLMYGDEPIVFPNEMAKERITRPKSDEQRAKEVAKRRKKNKNKKTHRKR